MVDQPKTAHMLNRTLDLAHKQLIFRRVLWARQYIKRGGNLTYRDWFQSRHKRALGGSIATGVLGAGAIKQLNQFSLNMVNKFTQDYLTTGPSSGLKVTHVIYDEAIYDQSF